jgi:protein-disulfide isomerase
MEVALRSQPDIVRLIFHHMPLSAHPWARIAAEGAACAQLQSSKAFWALHDEIFRQQQDITTGNAKEKIRQIAQKTESLDYPRFQECMNDQMSLGLVLRDLDLAAANSVDATPTLFINGHRI